VYQLGEMPRPPFVPHPAVTLLAAASIALSAPLRAQAAVTPTDTVRLAFGYICGDQFRVRNDGVHVVTAEYNVVGNASHTKVMLEPKESIEITSTAPGAVELRVNGKVVATEPKGSKPCVTVKPARPGGAPADSAQQAAAAKDSTSKPARTAASSQSPRRTAPRRPRPLVNPPYPLYAPPFYVPVTDMVWVLRPKY
jgi:hypothetical protein